MQKLRDSKNIKWKEGYTPKTQFLKDQFEAVIGEKSYRRWEGEEIDGPDNWYVIVSPAGVREHKRAKFFAGVRLLPATWSPGGKYFDTIGEAYNYAHETWGTPLPKGAVRYTAGDLKGISSRIDKWKARREQQETTSSRHNFDLFRIRKAMAKAAVYKDNLNFDISYFIPLIQDLDLNDANTSEILYRRILEAAGYSSREDVENDLNELANEYGDAYARTYLPKASSSSGMEGEEVEKEVLDNGEVRKFVRWKRENWGLARPEGQGRITDRESAYRFAAQIMTIGRKKREEDLRDIRNAVGELSVENLEALDPRHLRSHFEATLLCAYVTHKKNRDDLVAHYDFSYYAWDKYLLHIISQNLDESWRQFSQDDQLADTQGARSIEQFEGLVKSNPDFASRYLRGYMSFAEFSQRISSDPQFSRNWGFRAEDTADFDNQLPVRTAFTYGKRRSGSGYFINSHYNGLRSWDKRISFGNNAFQRDANGFNEIEYAILGLRGASRTESEPADIRSDLDSLGDIPARIVDYLENGTISAKGMQTQKIGRSTGISANNFKIAIEHIRKNIIPSLPSVRQTALLNNLVSSFTGWKVFLTDTEYRKGKSATFDQENKAKSLGALYGGQKAVSDHFTSKGLAQILDREASAIFSSVNTVPVGDLLTSLSSLTGYEELSEDDMASARLLLEGVRGSGDSISKDSFNRLVRDNGLSNMIRRADINRIFAGAISGGTNVPVKDFVNKKILKLFRVTGPMIKSFGLQKFNLKNSLEGEDISGLSVQQRAVLNYTRRKGWHDIARKLEEGERESLSDFTFRRILRQQVENVDGTPIRIFPEEVIDREITSQKTSFSSGVLGRYGEFFEEGDAELRLVKTTEGIATPKCSFTDFFYFKVMKNKFRNEWDLMSSNPSLYEDIMRTYFIPEGLRDQVENIGGPIVRNSRTGEVVTTDDLGNTLEVRDGIVRARGTLGAVIMPSNASELIVGSPSPEENIIQIEAAIDEHFSSGENRSSYRLGQSLSSNYFPPNTTRNLTVRGRVLKRESPFLNGLTKIEAAQKRVLVEIAKDLTAHVRSEEIQDPVMILEGADAQSSEYTAFLGDLVEAIEGGRKLTPDKKGEAIRNALRKLHKITGVDAPYKITNHDEPYRRQISASGITSKVTSNLGFPTFVRGEGGRMVNIAHESDVARNPMNFALISNNTFEGHSERLSLVKGAPDLFEMDESYVRDNDQQAKISSMHLAVAHRMRGESYRAMSSTNQDETRETIRNSFTIQAAQREMVEAALTSAVSRRIGTPPTRFDPRMAGIGTKGEDSIPWFNVATPNFPLDTVTKSWERRQWARRAIIITANSVSNWLLTRKLPGVEGSMDANILGEILGLDPSDQTVTDIIGAVAESEREINRIQEDPHGVVEDEAAVSTDSAAAIGEMNTESEPAVEGEEDQELDQSELQTAAPEEEIEKESKLPESPEGELEPVEVTETERGISPSDSEIEQVQVDPEPKTVVPEEPSEYELAPPSDEGVTVVEQDETGFDEEEDWEALLEKQIKSKRSHSLLNLTRVAKAFIANGSFKKAAAINRYVRSNLPVTNCSKNEKRAVVLATLCSLMNISKKFMKEGKTKNARELNLVIRKYVDILSHQSESDLCEE